MTDRYKGVYVQFDHDIREDDIEAVVDAFKAFRFVAKVHTDLSKIEDDGPRELARIEVRQQILDVLYPDRKKR